MSLLNMPGVQVVRSATHLEIELLKRPAPLIEFADDEAERAYGEQDYQLACKLDKLAANACGDRSPADLVFTNWDWSADNSRALTVDRSLLSVDLIHAMQRTLTGAYASWRIHLNVNQNLAASGDELGSACLFADAVILEQALCYCLSLPA